MKELKLEVGKTYRSQSGEQVKITMEPGGYAGGGCAGTRVDNGLLAALWEQCKVESRATMLAD